MRFRSVLLFCVLGLAAGASAPPRVAGGDDLERGQSLSSRGQFEEAIAALDEAVAAARRESDPRRELEASIELSEAHLALGQLRQASEALDRARQAAVSADEELRARAELARCELDLAGLRFDSAARCADRVAATPSLAARALQVRGDARRGAGDAALRDYLAASEAARAGGHGDLAASALTRAAGVALSQRDPARAETWIAEARAQASALPPSHDQAYLLIRIAAVELDLAECEPGRRRDLTKDAVALLDLAATAADEIGDARAASLAWGRLGRVYEDEGRDEEALQLTRRAVFAAQKVYAPEILYRWQWQTGRLLRKRGDSDGAIDAYRRALTSLGQVRQDLAGIDRESFSFRQVVGPTYVEMVDLLLRRAASAQDPQRRQADLREARALMESLKIAELQDYFRDDCVNAARSKAGGIDALSRDAAVLYPILLPDRTEVLVSFPEGLRRFTAPVSASAMNEEANAFRRTLEKRTSREYMEHAQRLYDWLIRPIEPDIRQRGLTTLVFVPDGALRSIPLAALHDGQQFLVERYAIAVTPGLELTDSRPFPRDHVRLLAAGLTEGVQGFPPLASVSSELDALAGLFPGIRLVDGDFNIARLSRELEGGGYSVVHIASHGEFRSDARDTFLLTFEDRLTMNGLGDLVGPFRYRDEPLELLTLSACQTASGDERAALGLAGVAVKAGAKSALATLWYVDDKASAELVTDFYRQLRDPAVSKAAALQSAQLSILRQPRYSHPCYWSPFVLINNWL